MFRYLGDQQIDDLSAAVALSPPAGCQGAVIQAQAQNVRGRGGGSDPTAAVGWEITAGSTITWLILPISGLKLIQEAAGAKAFVIYVA